MESIFQNLPNNLIMNIIKMETDRANEEIRLGLIESKKKFMDCIMQLCEVEEYILDTLDGQDERDYYLSDARANYESENGNLFYGCMLNDLFDEIDDSNENNKKDIEEEEYRLSLQEPSDEERYEQRFLQEPSEDDYNHYEPDWA